MHEMSLALEVCRIAEEQVGIHRLPRVREVGVRVGHDSGIEPENLEFCLEALLSRPPFGRAHPALEHCPGDELRLSYLEIEDDDPQD